MLRFLLFVICFVLGLACHREVCPSATRDLIGVWTTNDAKYADRYFEFREDGHLVFGTGEAGDVACVITDVRIEKKGGRSQDYTVTYVDPEGVESVFAFQYSTRKKRIQIPNQEGIVWRRREP